MRMTTMRREVEAMRRRTRRRGEGAGAVDD
jgi:hypothetical protein